MKKRCENCFCSYDDEFEVCPDCGYYKGKKIEVINQLSIGTTLNKRYTIGKVLGFGGFGITYKAWDNSNQSVVAIKEYFPSSFVNRNPTTNEVIIFTGKRKAEFEYGLSRFLEEAKNLAKFNDNDNIVNAYGYFEENNTAYIVMEFLDGMALNEYMRTNELSVDQSVSLALKVCAALDDIHKEGILHRDVSPDNIFMCSDGRVKIIDFGAARLSSTEDKLRTIVLKPGFAPPEQYESVSVQGPWTDIYALGATLYYLVTGVKPDESTNRRTNDILKSPQEINPMVPENIGNSIMKAMALDRHLRFYSCEEFSSALRNEREIIPLKLEIKRRKIKRGAGIIAAVLVLSIITAIFSTVFKKEKDENTLPNASIEVWYLIENEKYEKEREHAFESIKSDFCGAYSTVKVKIVGIPKEEYVAKFNKAVTSGKTPALFDSSILPNDSKTYVNLNEELSEIDSEGNCYLLDEYIKKCNTKKAPLGFVTPMIFENTKKAQQNIENVSFESIGKMQKKGIAVSKECRKIFESVFDTSADNYKMKNVDSFYNNESAYLISFSSEFFKVNSSLAGKYKILDIESKKTFYKPCNFFSVANLSENEIIAAKAFLKYLYSAKSQDVLHTDGKTMSFPVNKTAFSSFTEIYSQLSTTEEKVKKMSIIN